MDRLDPLGVHSGLCGAATRHGIYLVRPGAEKEQLPPGPASPHHQAYPVCDRKLAGTHPSKVEVPRPSSSSATSESGVACRRMALASLHSTMKVLSPAMMRSWAPATRHDFLTIYGPRPTPHLLDAVECWLFAGSTAARDRARSSTGVCGTQQQTAGVVLSLQRSWPRNAPQPPGRHTCHRASCAAHMWAHPGV